MPDPTDEDLMLAYRAGSAAAFDTLYERHKGRLYRHLLRQCGERPLAEELFQETWMKLIKARKRYEPRARFTTWLFHIAHNLLIDHYRRGNPGLPASFDESTTVDDPPANGRTEPEREAAARQATGRLLDLIADLPEAQREAFLMREEGGLSLEAIAEATGVGRETAKSRLRYAVAALRRGMQEFQP
ncbi:MAG: RNA polymerase sigma factor [Arenicellales bacterium]